VRGTGSPPDCLSATRYKKNLKNLYVVHPSAWHKFLMAFAEWFIRCVHAVYMRGTLGGTRPSSQPGNRRRSAKFMKKIVYITRLEELTPHMRLDQLDIPADVWRSDPPGPKGKVRGPAAPEW
jgi:hypothetical protein